MPRVVLAILLGVLIASGARAATPLAAGDKLAAVASVKATAEICGWTLPDEDLQSMETAMADLAAKSGVPDDDVEKIVGSLRETIAPYHETICTEEGRAAIAGTVRQVLSLATAAEGKPEERERLRALYFYELGSIACDIDVDDEVKKAVKAAQESTKKKSGLTDEQADEVYIEVSGVISKTREGLCADDGAFVTGYQEQLKSLLGETPP